MPHIQFVQDRPYLIADIKGEPIIMSGGFGSLINAIMKRTGVMIDSVQKGSEFRAPIDVFDVVVEAHTQYGLAGAGIFTLDTFCASLGRQNGEISLVEQFIRAAGNAGVLARRSFNQNIIQAACITSEGDCYTPDDKPDDSILLKNHLVNVNLLKSYAQADLLMIETMPTQRETEIIAGFANAAQMPFAVVFTVDNDGHIFDGSKMIDAVKTIVTPNAYCVGIGVNCCTIEGAQAAVLELGTIFRQQNDALRGRHILAYPNGYKLSREENAALSGSCTSGNCVHVPEVFSPEEMLGVSKDLVERGATMIGGCCGTAPEHIQKIYSAHLRLPDFQPNITYKF